jgi:hypothetical protein
MGNEKHWNTGGTQSDTARAKAARAETVRELRRALADGGSGIDYEQFWADVDGNLDHSPKDWYEWAAHTDRHVCLDRLEEV